MPLGPDDVVNYPLKQSMRGYSIRQVDELLDLVADELERLQRELDDANRRLDRAERKAETLDETESTLRRTLVTAQRAAEETIEEARRRADELLEDARREAVEARDGELEAARRREDELRGRHEALLQTIEELEDFEASYRDSLREMLREQLERLDDADARPGDLPEREPPEPSSEPAGARLNADGEDPAVDEQIFDRPGRDGGG